MCICAYELFPPVVYLQWGKKLTLVTSVTRGPI